MIISGLAVAFAGRGYHIGSLGTYGGFAPAFVSCVFVSAVGDCQKSVRDAGLFSCLMVAAGDLILHWG